MRKFLLWAAVLFAAFELTASPVDLGTAQAKAQNYVRQHLSSGKFMAPIVGEMKLAHAEMNSMMKDRAVYYIFNNDNGYVIVSGDDRAEEILGYGDYKLDMNNIPCNMKTWLENYKTQLEYLQAHEELVVKPSIYAAPSLRIATVSPLLTCNWDQEAPYWNQCVISNNQCLTGCPATSAAQVFYYWKYPDFETPEVPAYQCYLSTSFWGGHYVNVAALPPVTFDWDNMLDNYGNSSSYTTAQGNAVATLMRYIGQAEHMEYGISWVGSGVAADSVILIADAFKFFGYDEESVRMVKKTSAYSGGTTLYTDDEWAAMIQEELAEGRPIVYCAVSSSGGHAFNVDGYNETTNKYHINWGWSGDENNYFALNAFNGGGSVFNQYQQMVIGIQPPMTTPRLKVDKSEISMECFKNETATEEFTLTGRNMQGNVTLTLHDDNDVFVISKETVVPSEDAKVNESIVVTYTPKAEGEYTATVTVSSPGVEDLEITLHGTSAYELYTPVMLSPDPEAITATSFRANWTDATPVENVTSYTLEVKVKPALHLLTEADWSDVPKESANHASDAANYMPEGWTFTGNTLYLDGGFISTGRNSVIDPGCDLAGYDKVSVIITGMAYRLGTSTSTIDIATDVETKTLTLARELDTYLVVLEVGDNGFVKFTTGYLPEIQSIKIYGGEITDLDPFTIMTAHETGDAEMRLIEGITPNKFYTVTGLLPATPYVYRVKARYVNGTESLWSNTREVVLLDSGQSTRGDVNGDGNVAIDDVTTLIDMLLFGVEPTDLDAVDCDLDGQMSIADVTKLIDYLLFGEW